MSEYNELIKRFTAIEDELVRLRKQRNYELFNLDENNIPRLRQYSQIISENQAAVSLVEQKVSDVESSVTLLSQYTSMDNVVVVEASDDKTKWDKTRVYYDKTAKIYYYYDGNKWTATASPVTAGLDTAIAKIEAKTAENEAEISLVSKSVTQNTQSITGLETLTGQIDGEITTIKTNLAEVTTKADDNETAISLVAKSVTDIESDISGLENANKTINESIAAIQFKADGNASDITLLAQSVSRNASDIIGLQETAGNIDKELTTVKTNLASVETKADDAAASAEIATRSVTELEDEFAGQVETLSGSIASVKLIAQDNKSTISVLSEMVSDNYAAIATVKSTADSAGASVALLAQYTSMDNVVNVTSNTNTSWDKAKVYYNTSTKKYWYYNTDSKAWVSTNDPVTSAASIVAKINAAGSAVQISADHISLKGKTIALTTDSINISSTYFNVAMSGAVTCTSLAVTGGNNSINVTGTSYSSSIIKVSYNDLAYATDIRPNGVYSVTGALGFEGSPQRVQVSANGNYQYSNLSSYEVICNYLQYTYPTFHANSNANQVIVGGMFTCLGLKSRTEQTKHYGNRLMYAFESPNPLYSDFGRASIADDGLCYVFIDPVFYECIDNNYDYFVFIQPESDGEFAVIERTADHFIVQGTPGKSFAWMLVTAQKGYSATRTEELIIPEPEPVQTPDPENVVYDAVGDEILKEFENQLG